MKKIFYVSLLSLFLSGTALYLLSQREEVSLGAGVGSTWQLLASTSTAQSVSTTTPLRFATSTDLQVIIHIPPMTAGAPVHLQFNGDTGGNYAYAYSENGGAPVSAASQSVIRFSGATDNSNGLHVNAFVTNATAIEKGVSWTGHDTSAGTVDQLFFGGAMWHNSTLAVTTVTIGSSGPLPANTRITVYGR